MYYVKAVTRSSGGSARGTPRRAIGYITDGHDARRDPGCSEAELRYIARLDEGWKTELEGGRVPLVGFGCLEGVRDAEELTSRFEGACQPWHDRRGSTGYKSFTFTLPKEVSLVTEGHREGARVAIYAGVREALARAFPGKEIAAVAAVHTRNEAGEIHFHAHVLVAKFARDRTTARMVSLNSKAGGNSPTRIRDLKAGWKEGVDRELAARLGLRVEQSRSFARPALVLKEGTRLPPLDRDSRRMLDKLLAPTYEESTPSGQVVRKVLRLNDAMDGRIFEVASGAGGAGWSAAGFLAVAPEQARYLGRYEKRVATLKKAGYLTPDGKLTPAFRTHYAARQGVDTPELQRLRLDVVRQAARESELQGRPVPVPALAEAVDRDTSVRRRVERLGLTREQLRRIHEEAEKRKPTPAILRVLRKQFEREALVRPPERVQLPQAKTLTGAYLAYQKARVRAAGLMVAGVFRLQYTKHKKIAAAIRAGASRDLFYAKERRLAQVGTFLRPMFWATRLVLPRQTRRLELAIARCVALVKTREVTREWRRDFVAKHKRRLIDRAALRAIPAQVPAQVALVAPVQQALPSVAPSAGRDRRVHLLRTGLAFMRRHRPDVAALLEPWEHRLPELEERVSAVGKGSVDQLQPQIFDAAVRAGRAATLLEREKEARPVPVPTRLAAHEKEIQRVQARFYAIKHGEVLSREMLESLSPKRVELVLKEVRQLGAADEGQGWVLRQRDMASLVKTLLPTLRKEMERDRVLS